ncbi:unnamed protein product [Mycena citricolor]|uniref:HMG domain-containing protein n=1 Tax=Mycena citricolor TaxID=2018698 RepID=A0AAD2HMX1_9AGAR|nr:unnamed protein product [Mycena citricolor]
MNSDNDYNSQILLETPPPSPTQRIGLSTPSTVAYALPTITPTRKQRREQTKRLPRAVKPIPALNLEVLDEPAWTKESAGLPFEMGTPETMIEMVDFADIEAGVTGTALKEGAAGAGIDAEDGYGAFCAHIQEEGGAFYQIGSELFVVNGWEISTKSSKTSVWYHLQRSLIGGTQVIVCRCPSSKPDYRCVHERFLCDYGEELFPVDVFFKERDADMAVLFSRYKTGDGIYLNHFSAQSSNSRSLSGRVIIQYQGNEGSTGSWKGPKDSFLYGFASDELEGTGAVETFVDYQVTRQCRSTREIKAVSHLPVLPPIWASLPTNPVLYQRPAPLVTKPDTLVLSESSTCACSDLRYSFNPSLPISERPCTVYGLYRSWSTVIQVQSCGNPSCHHRLVGPDCRELGIFNYNNTRLFLHKLLDEYTSAYTSSETPFSAWVLTLGRRYELHRQEGDDCGEPFPSAEVFRAVWFLYVKLQYLEGDMMCPKCGPLPENTIWDGVTLAFNRKHLLPSLEPPTVTQLTSDVRDRTKYMPNQQLIPDRKARHAIRKVITGRPLTLSGLKNLDAKIRAAKRKNGTPGDEDPEEGSEEEDDANVEDTSAPMSHAQRSAQREQADYLSRMSAISQAVDGLKKLSIVLAKMFESEFGDTAIASDHIPSQVYVRFFAQLSADESALQMLTSTGMENLNRFIRVPSKINISLLYETPTIYELIKHEMSLGPLTTDTVKLCNWLLIRGREVFQELRVAVTQPGSTNSGLPTRLLGEYQEHPWAETGCCYGLPKIRERPVYPKLIYDSENKVGGKRGAKCSKFYSQYGERRLTGGIMCVWCTHSVCYGFHCIPRGEGRNDVFSASSLIVMWTHVWPTSTLVQESAAIADFHAFAKL